MSTYSHVAPEVSREAAERMARMLWHDAAEDQADDDPGGTANGRRCCPPRRWRWAWDADGL
jgi:hypothetical protein